MVEYLFLYLHVAFDVFVIGFILHLYMKYVHYKTPPPGTMGVWIGIYCLVKIYEMDAGL